MATAEVIPISLIQHFFTLSCGIDIISKDGSVRLLSPVTGEIITTFFPIFTANVCILSNLFSSLQILSLSLSHPLSQMLSDVVYCPLGRLLFALLETGDVLAVSALTNPCSTLQLWTSQHSREKIDTISTVCVYVYRTRSCSFEGYAGSFFEFFKSHYFKLLPSASYFVACSVWWSGRAGHTLWCLEAASVATSSYSTLPSSQWSSPVLLTEDV